MGISTADKEKRIDELDIFDGKKQPKWKGDQSNPDHLLGRVNAANDGFVSNLNRSKGSWVIYKMYSKYMDALKSRGRVPYIHAVFDAIQSELQLEGRQLPECVWNDNIRYLTFGRRTKRKQEIAVDDDVKIEEDVEEKKEQPKLSNADIP